MMLTKEYLHELFEYRDGKLYWKKAKGKVSPGDHAGHKQGAGYLQVRIDGVSYLVHRIIWQMFFGTTPEFLDHINGICDDNRIENLRAANKKQNSHNRKITARNKSGIKGISWDKSRNKWRVTLVVGGMHKNLGRYEDIELAELVAIEAREKYHGEFARHE